MISGVTILCGFIVAGNIHDPGTNLLFVQHVFSMDTIVPVSAMADHAISSPLLWRIAFWLIVTGEGLTAALFAFGAAGSSFGPEAARCGILTKPSGLSSPEPVADLWFGSSAFWPLGASGLRCGNPRSGTVSQPHSASSRQFFSF